MKFLLEKLSAVVFTAAALLLAALLFTVAYQDVGAAINRNEPVPVTWMAAGGSNSFGLSSTAVPTLLYRGTNYTGVTTNLAFSDGAATNTIRVVNGIITAILD